MASLSEQLKALGVKIGTADLIKKSPSQNSSAMGINQIIPGEEINTIYGSAFRIQEVISINETYGITPLQFAAAPELLAMWCGENEISSAKPEEFIFIDTETTGLGLGAGILAFLIGIGYYQGSSFKVDQYFVRSPGEETAILAAVSQSVSDHKFIVSYNGKAFDLPILNNRFTINGLTSPFKDSTHLDLLHLARRLWNRRLTNRSLISIEAEILGASRSLEDIPGWIIPQLYQDYLHTGDARLIKSVFYHNAKDILALAALLSHIAALLDHPLDRPDIHILDLVSIGVLQEALDRKHDAVSIYEYVLRCDLPQETRSGTVKRLSYLYKRMDQWLEAVRLWEFAAKNSDGYAYIELAKFYEHQAKDLDQAYYWVLQGLENLSSPVDRLEWGSDLEYRMERILRKLGK